MTDRLDEQAAVAARLGSLDDDAFVGLLRDCGAAWVTGWGAHATIEVAGTPVFVKRLPVTALEAKGGLSTSNHHDLPTFYNYGVGSAGFGAARELAAHVRTSAWVQEGVADGFPLLYHHRRVPRFDDAQLDWTVTASYFERWDGNANIRAYIAARRDATEEVVLCCEHVPHDITTWLLDHPDGIDDLIAQLFTSVAAMRGGGMAHFDAHFGNTRIGGARPRLVDLGLVLDASFDLSASERTFFERHAYYDAGLVCWSLGQLVLGLMDGLDPERRVRVDTACGIAAGQGRFERARVLLDRLDVAAPLVDERIGPELMRAIRRYRRPAVYMSHFFEEMHAGTRKDAVYDDDVMRQLLVDAGLDV